MDHKEESPNRNYDFINSTENNFRKNNNIPARLLIETSTNRSVIKKNNFDFIFNAYSNYSVDESNNKIFFKQFKTIN